MLAAVTRSPGVMVVGQVPEPGPPGPQDVIVRPEVVGICGSDLHFYTGDTGALSGARSFFPRIQGHEFSAVVEQLGRDCPGGVGAGDRVAVWPLRGCGRCYPCRAGRANACVSLELVGIHRDGGLQQLLSVPASQVFGVGDLDPEPAAFIEPMSIAVDALDRADVRAGQPERNHTLAAESPVARRTLNVGGAGMAELPEGTQLIRDGGGQRLRGCWLLAPFGRFLLADVERWRAAVGRAIAQGTSEAIGLADLRAPLAAQGAQGAGGVRPARLVRGAHMRSGALTPSRSRPLAGTVPRRSASMISPAA